MSTLQVPARGRPRDTTRDDALRAAALEVLAEVGYRALTMDAVAAKAKAGKATIYRRWDSKLHLVIDACHMLAARVIGEPDSGSVREDLVQFLLSFARLLTGPTGRAAHALVSELPHEPELARRFREAFLVPHRATMLRLLERGIARGEVDPAAPHEMVVELSGATLTHRRMINGEPLDDAFVTRLVDDALLPLLRPLRS